MVHLEYLNLILDCWRKMGKYQRKPLAHEGKLANATAGHQTNNLHAVRPNQHNKKFIKTSFCSVMLFSSFPNGNKMMIPSDCNVENTINTQIISLPC